MFAVDVFRCKCQFVLVVWEYVTSFTMACLIRMSGKRHLERPLPDNVTAPLDGPFSVVWTDLPWPGCAALVGDEWLAKHRVVIEVGNAKNVNKNLVAERVIQEVQAEVLRLESRCGTPLLLSIATSHLNSLIRSQGLLSKCYVTPDAGQQHPPSSDPDISCTYTWIEISHRHATDTLLLDPADEAVGLPCGEL